MSALGCLLNINRKPLIMSHKHIADFCIIGQIGSLYIYHFVSVLDNGKIALETVDYINIIHILFLPFGGYIDRFSVGFHYNAAVYIGTVNLCVCVIEIIQHLAVRMTVIVALLAGYNRILRLYGCKPFFGGTRLAAVMTDFEHRAFNRRLIAAEHCVHRLCLRVARKQKANIVIHRMNHNRLVV